jgi:uncharacterized membrane protein
MKKLVASLLAYSLVAVVGCQRESTPGGPGKTGKTDEKVTRTEAEPGRTEKTTSKTEADRSEDTFTIKVPGTATNIERGKRQEVTISIDRGDAFKQNVKLQFKAPEGLKVIPPDPVVKTGENEAKVLIEVADNAPPGEKAVEVTGTPDTGKPTSVTMKVQVEKKD